jgi:hypothetical protein
MSWVDGGPAPVCEGNVGIGLGVGERELRVLRGGGGISGGVEVELIVLPVLSLFKSDQR